MESSTHTRVGTLLAFRKRVAALQEGFRKGIFPSYEYLSQTVADLTDFKRTIPPRDTASVQEVQNAINLILPNINVARQAAAEFKGLEKKRGLN